MVSRVGAVLLAVLLACPALGARPAAAAPERTVVIVLDDGPAMTKAGLGAARRGVAGLVAALPPDVAVGLALPGASLAPATDRAPLLAAVEKAGLRGQGRVLDAVAGGLAALPPDGERRLVVVTAGRDTASRTDPARMARDVALKGVAVELFGVGASAAKSPVVRRLAASPGSRVRTASNAARLASQMAEAGRDLFGAAPPGARPAAGPTAASAEPAEPPAEPSEAAPAGGGTGPSLGALLGLCFVVILVAVYLLGEAFFAPRSDVSHRIEEYRPRAGGGGGEGTGGGRGRGPGGVLDGLLALSGRLVRASGRTEKIAARLDEAGWSLAPHEWGLLRGVACLLAVVGLWSFTDNLPVALLLGLALPLGIAKGVLAKARDRRVQAFADQLPDALAMIAGSLRSGFTVSQSLERLGSQEVQPLGVEMARALAQTKIGVSVEDALDQAADRMDCPDLRWVVMTIRIQREVGGNLADVIETTMETMRERTRLRRHIRALSAEGRMSAQVLIALPILLAVGLLLFRPDYLAPMLESPMGVLMLVFGAASVAVGWFWISRMIKIEA
ncbi:type II secretion system F family protein [Actinocorallia populi]|uniref:type II secretion system F family protein n=1 Tax=Actinocorallia populi TaxID=2079200 RepID=UPI000D095E8D|nr:type II secretion system F family protein [Actinocorallia populi]